MRLDRAANVVSQLLVSYKAGLLTKDERTALQVLVQNAHNMDDLRSMLKVTKQPVPVSTKEG